MNNLIGSGEIVNVLAPTGGYTKGDVVAYGADMVGIPASSVTGGALVALHLTGEFSSSQKRADASVWAAGKIVYLSPTGKLTATVTGQAAGVATAVAATGATTCQLIINRGFAA